MMTFGTFLNINFNKFKLYSIVVLAILALFMFPAIYFGMPENTEKADYLMALCIGAICVFLFCLLVYIAIAYSHFHTTKIIYKWEDFQEFVADQKFEFLLQHVNSSTQFTTPAYFAYMQNYPVFICMEIEKLTQFKMYIFIQPIKLTNEEYIEKTKILYGHNAYYQKTHIEVNIFSGYPDDTTSEKNWLYFKIMGLLQTMKQLDFKPDLKWHEQEIIKKSLNHDSIQKLIKHEL